MNLPDPVERIVTPFDDTVSQEFGDGFGLCGDQTYEVFESINGELTAVDFCGITLKPDGNYAIEVQSSD